MLPKFPDKQRRPGIIHLPQAISTPPRPTTKLPGLNPSAQKHPQAPQPPAEMPLKVLKQLRTPSPNGAAHKQHQHSRRHKQKRSSVGNILPNSSDISATSGNVDAPPTPDAVASSVDTKPSPGLVLLSPPPTPADRSNKKAARNNKQKSKAQGHARKPSKPISLPVSPPLTPEAFKFPPVAVEEAVFTLEGLLPAVSLAQDSSNDSLPLADEDEVIVWKQPQTPISALPTPMQRAPGTPSRTSSPTEFFNWEDIKALPRLSPETIAQLKEQYDIRPSEAFQHSKTLQPQEPDLLMSLLQSSVTSSCPPSPNGGLDASISFSSISKPISIVRRPSAFHSRAPSVPEYPTAGRLAFMQYREDVAEAFGLDVRDTTAVRRATEAWRAYAGSTFNNSPEKERVPAPKFLGRLFQ